MEHKSIALDVAQFKLDAEGSTFHGYASTFNNVDSYGDTILKGAYTETLQKFGMPRMFFNHKSDAVPIGKWVDAKEDDYGLLLIGEFTPGNALAQEVRAGLKHGTLDSMSIGYMLRKGDYEDKEKGRIIKKVSHLSETSIVTFPADKFARVDLTSVKFAEEMEQLETIRDFEMFLRDAGSFSKGAAQALTARAKVLFSLRDAGNKDEAKTEEALIIERLQKIGQ